MRHDPVFKLAIVVVGLQEVADAIEALPAQFCPRKVEGTRISRSETLEGVSWAGKGS